MKIDTSVWEPKTYGYHPIQSGRDIMTYKVLDNVKITIEYTYGGEVAGIIVHRPKEES